MDSPQSTNNPVAGSIEHLSAHHEQKQTQHSLLLQKLQEREADMLNKCISQIAATPPIVDAQVCPQFNQLVMIDVSWNDYNLISSANHFADPTPEDVVKALLHILFV